MLKKVWRHAKLMKMYARRSSGGGALSLCGEDDAQRGWAPRSTLRASAGRRSPQPHAAAEQSCMASSPSICQDMSRGSVGKTSLPHPSTRSCASFNTGLPSISLGVQTFEYAGKSGKSSPEMVVFFSTPSSLQLLCEIAPVMVFMHGGHNLFGRSCRHRHHFCESDMLVWSWSEMPTIAKWKLEFRRLDCRAKYRRHACRGTSPMSQTCCAGSWKRCPAHARVITTVASANVNPRTARTCPMACKSSTSAAVPTASSASPRNLWSGGQKTIIPAW